MCNVKEDFSTEELKPLNICTFKNDKLLSRKCHLKIDLENFREKKLCRIFCTLAGDE